LEVVAPAGTMRRSPELAFAQASDEMLQGVTARGAPPVLEDRPAAGQQGNEGPSSAAPTQDAALSLPSEQHASERATRPMDTAAKEPSVTAVDQAPRGGTAIVLDDLPDRPIDIARHDDSPTASIRSKDAVAMRDVRVTTFYRDRRGVLHQVVRVFRVEHEEP
jgi:hypothetical protein